MNERLLFRFDIATLNIKSCFLVFPMLWPFFKDTLTRFNKILAEKLDIFVIVYLDDILIYTKDSIQPYVKAVP